jgi:5-methylcytosine-specific restriction enzyme subunit McrC
VQKIITYEKVKSRKTAHRLLGKGISMLFPMEVLFERYVAAKLKSKFSPDYYLKEQVGNMSLTRHKSDDWFKLRPDIVVYCDRGNKKIVSVMDTKWKRLNQNANSRKEKYNLAQSDIYQLFAYGQKYLEGEGELYLIYPKHEAFNESLPSFDFSEKLKIHVVPYDLLRDECDINLISS